MLTVASLDYVFVDEHNRHKRLKGVLLTPATRQPWIGVY